MATDSWTDSADSCTTLGDWGRPPGIPGGGDDITIDRGEPGPSRGRSRHPGVRDGVETGRRDDPFEPKLSRRERACLDLLVRGLSDRDMSRKLAISAPTVRFHLDKARRKTGATSRTNLAALAIWLGLSRL